MLPSFTTSVPPRILSSVASETSFSNVLKVGKMDSLSVDSSKVAGTATLVAGTVNVTIPGIESTDLVFVTLKSAGGTLGLQYMSAFTAAVGATPAYVTITSRAANGTVSNADTSIVQYLVVKPYPVIV
jgi:hypothetical protein